MADFSLNRFPSASTMYRPRVLSGGAHPPSVDDEAGAAKGRRTTTSAAASNVRTSISNTYAIGLLSIVARGCPSLVSFVRMKYGPFFFGIGIQKFRAALSWFEPGMISYA